MKEVALICGLLAGLLGVISGVAFLNGSKAMPWDLQSYKSQTEPERAFRATAQWWNRLGVFALMAAFALSAASSLASYYG